MFEQKKLAEYLECFVLITVVALHEKTIDAVVELAKGMAVDVASLVVAENGKKSAFVVEDETVVAVVVAEMEIGRFAVVVEQTVGNSSWSRRNNNSNNKGTVKISRINKILRIC